MVAGYDAIAQLGNASYSDTRDIRAILKDTELPFDIVSGRWWGSRMQWIGWKQENAPYKRTRWILVT